jgi:hypothetical protein
MGEYTLEWKERIHNRATNGNNYHEVRGDQLILYRNAVPLYRVENILAEKGCTKKTQKGSTTFYTGTKYMYIYDNNNRIYFV